MSEQEAASAQEVADTNSGAPSGEQPRAGLVSMAAKLESLMSGVKEKVGAQPQVQKPAPPNPQKTDAPTNQPAQPPAPQSAADDSVPDIIKSPKAAAEWRNLKRELGEWKRRAEQAELSRNDNQLKAELDDLKSRYEKVSEELRLTAIERHPDFVGQFKPRIEAAVAQAKRAAGPDNADAIDRILNMPESEAKIEAINELMEGIPTFQQRRLEGAITDYEKLIELKNAKIAEAARDYEARGMTIEQEQQRLKSNTMRAISESVEEALNNARSLSAFGDSAKPEDVNERRQFVRDFINGKLESGMYPWVPILAAEAMHLRETAIPAFEAEIASLKEQLAALSGASPAAGGGQQTSSSPSGGEARGFISKFKANWPG